jgi:hypothetical protein
MISSFLPFLHDSKDRLPENCCLLQAETNFVFVWLALESILMIFGASRFLQYLLTWLF